MVDPKQFELTVSNLRCFDDFQGFCGIFPINLIVGRNNAGKSALLDFVQAIISNKFNRSLDRRGNRPAVRIGFDLTEAMIKQLVDESAPDDGIVNFDA